MFGIPRKQMLTLVVLISSTFVGILNPQLILYSAALGPTAFWIRILTSILCGIVAGLLLRWLYRDKPFFDFTGFSEARSKDTDPNLLMRYLKNLGGNVKATGKYFLVGVALSALFQQFVPSEWVANLFGPENLGFGVLMAATIGVPLYACGGGTIPLLQAWLLDGGSSSNFMFGMALTKQDDFLQSMAEAAKSVSGYEDGGKKMLYISVLNNISIDCDCVSNPAVPEIHDIGIVASTDPVAIDQECIDQACIDLVYDAPGNESLVQRIESRNGLMVLKHAEEIGLGTRSYKLVSINE